MSDIEHDSRPCPYSAPLQTSNNLNGKERSRLVRSTRKLGAVLGATPQLSENVDWPCEAYRTHKSSPPSESSSSASSIRSTSSVQPLVKPTRRHASVCEHPTRADVYASPSSASSTVSLALPPSRTTSLSSRSRKPSMKFGRSRCKSKPQPADAPRPLVLRLAAAPRALAGPPAPKSPGALLTLPATPGTPGTPSSFGSTTPTTPVFPTAAETRRKRMAKLTRTLGEIIPPHLVFGARKHAPPEPEIVVSIEGYTKPVDVAPAATLPRTRQRRSMSVDFGAQGALPTPPSQCVWVTGNSTWQGEWNRDIREVQHGLRSLKTR